MPVADSSSLFVSLRKHFADRENCPENYLTDCVAAALVEDASLARDWVELLLAGQDGVPGLESAAIEIHTQVREDSASIPDLIVELVLPAGRLRIGVEHKLGAPEGFNQLGRYVRLPGLWAVAAITRRGVRTQMEELSSGCAKWLHPAPRAHFTWTDFYPLVEDHARRDDAPVLTRALLGLFDDLRFAPPHAEVGRLGRGGSDLERTKRTAFFDNWSMTGPILYDRGWTRVHPGKNSQLYFVDRAGSTGRIVRGILSPLADDGRVLRMKLRYAVVEERDAARSALEGALATIPHGRYVTSVATIDTRADGKHPFLDINVPMTRVLPTNASQTERSAALAAYVRAVLAVVD